MMIRKKIIFFTLLVAALLVISSCERTGEPYPNSDPIIYITSYGGVDSLAAVTDSLLFQQTIYWEAYDSDGWVESFAYRILNEDGQAISTPDMEYIVGDENGNGITDDDEGWVLHYKDGADESISMEDPEAQTTIWTDAVYAEVNFPANGEQIFDPVTGDPVLDEYGNYVYEPVTSIFEIKCIDDREEESQIFRRYFKSTSYAPSILALESTQGQIDGKRIGTGVVLKFRIEDNDPLIGNVPDYFLFKLQIKDTDGNIIPAADGGYPEGPIDGGWYSTKGQDEVTEFTLIPEAAAAEGSIGPFIIPNTIDPNNEEAFLDSTFLTAVAYDLAGIPSQPYTISFAVKEGFYPGTMIYCGFDPLASEPHLNYTYNDIFAIGEYHYSTSKNEFISSIDVPEEVTADGYEYGLPLWVDREGRFTAINSPDLKIYMHWGYQGEYGEIGQESNTVTNSPYNQRIGEVLDETTQELYFSELKYFDLQLDGQPYHYPPLAGLVETVEIDTLGFFTRIPVGSDIDQRTILYDLESGEHVFRVRAVDLSNIGDPTPAEMRFTLVDPVLPGEKEHKILIIDEDADNALFSPDAILDSLYLEYFSDYTGEIEEFDLWENSNSAQEIETDNSTLHFSNDQVSPTDLQEYELVVYHNDKPNASSKFHRNNDTFRMFFNLGGNMLASMGDNIYNVYDNCNLNAFYLLEDNFGIANKKATDDPDLVTKISGSNFTNPFMIGANPVSPWATAINLELAPDMVWNSLINTVQGLGPVAYFSPQVLQNNIEYPEFVPPTAMYNYVCKETTAEVNPPTADQYEEFNGKTVAIRHDNGISKNYMFGFALPYMETAEVKAMINEILADLNIQ